jgi:hypothetical protein
VCLPFETEGETQEACERKGGRFVVDSRWMMHTWVVPGFENDGGVFAYLNEGLQRQQVAFNGGDPDSDGDGLRDSVELRYGQNPISRDTDGDGIADGDDVDALAAAVGTLPESAFTGRSEASDRATALTLVDEARSALGRGDFAGAVTHLEALHSVIGDCTIAAENAPWMESCTPQIEARDHVQRVIESARG